MVRYDLLEGMQGQSKLQTPAFHVSLFSKLSYEIKLNVVDLLWYLTISIGNWAYEDVEVNY